MLRPIVLTFCFIPAVLFSHAQILFECKSPNGDTTTYLLGTHHRLPVDKFTAEVLLDSLIKKSNAVFVEMYGEVGDPDYREFTKDMRRVASYPSGKKLNDYLTAEKIAIIRRFYQDEFRITDSVFEIYSRVTPFFMDYYLRSTDQKNFALDDWVKNKAIDHSVLIERLDKFGPALKTYQWLRNSFKTDSLLTMTDQYPIRKQQVEDLLNAYISGDTSGISVFIESMYTYEYINELIIKRNKSWEKVLNKESKSVNFVAVGASHISYHGGLLEYYRRKNYQIRRIEF